MRFALVCLYLALADGQVTCPAKELSHGRVEPPTQRVFNGGERVYVTCDPGYVLNGASPLTCTKYGWVGLQSSWYHPTTCKPVPTPAPVAGYVTADDILEQFCVDGDFFTIQNGNEWFTADRVQFTSYANVIGVKATDTGVIAGIAASFNDGTETNEQWKCTATQPASNWCKPWYDDSHWPTAHAMDKGQNPWSLDGDITATAKWIWTSGGRKGHPGYNPTVWCRFSYPDPPA